MLHIFYCIAPIFALIAIGYITKYKFIQSNDFWSGSEKITYYLLFPALLINSMATVDISLDLHQVILPLVLATLLLGLSLIFLQKILKIEHAAFTSYFQGAIRYNSYVFIGVATALYGLKVLPIVSIIIAYMIVLTNVVSVIILSIYTANKKLSVITILKGILKNPLVVSCFIGLFINKINFLYPPIIATLFNFLGSAALPISLMAVGAGLKLGHLAKNFKPIILVNIAKLFVLPIISLFFLNLFGASAGVVKSIAILYAAVPCAGNAYILALQMRGDHQTMAAIISTTTLLSILTIPIIISLTN